MIFAVGSHLNFTFRIIGTEPRLHQPSSLRTLSHASGNPVRHEKQLGFAITDGFGEIRTELGLGGLK